MTRAKSQRTVVIETQHTAEPKILLITVSQGKKIVVASFSIFLYVVIRILIF
jgi:hypothetical protein